MIENVVEEIPDPHRAPRRIGETFKRWLQFSNRADSNFVPVEEFVGEPGKDGLCILNRRIFQAHRVEQRLQHG